MLARNFKSATDLGIPENVYAGLIKVLGMMERGELRHKTAALVDSLTGLANRRAFLTNQTTTAIRTRHSA